MDIPITVPQLIVLKYLARNNNSVTIGELKRGLISETDEINSSIELLRKQDYLITNENEVSLNGKGISFINDYDQIASLYVGNEDLDGAIICFLYTLDAPISSKWFPSIIQEKAPVTSMSKPEDGFHLFDYIQYKSTKNNYILLEKNKFSLKQSGKVYYESKIDEENKKSTNRDFEMKNKILESKIKELTLDSLEFQKENRELGIKLSKAQLKEIRTKKLYSFLGVIGGAILTLLITYAKEIYKFLKELLK